MEDGHLLARLESIDNRLSQLEKSVGVINHELGVLCGKTKVGTIAPMLIRYVILPLIVITGALVGVKLFVV